MFWITAVSILPPLLALTTVPHFRLAYDARTWWTCELHPADCMGELLRKISRLISLPECTNRVYYLADTGHQLRDIQHTARLLERERGVDRGGVYRGGVDREGVDREGTGQRCGQFSPVMEVLANVALQKAEVCFVDGFAIKELVSLVRASKQHALPTHRQTSTAHDNLHTGQTAGPSSPSSTEIMAQSTGIVNQGADVTRQPTMANQPTDVASQAVNAADNRTDAQAADQTACKLPSDTANMIRHKLATLKGDTPRLQAELDEFKEVVDGYERMGKASERNGGQRMDFYQRTQQDRVDIDLARQFKQLALDLRRKLSSHEKTIESNKERLKEYESILSAAGCPVNATISTSSLRGG